LLIHIVMQDERNRGTSGRIMNEYSPRRRTVRIALWAAVLSFLTVFSPAGSRAPLPGEGPPRSSARERIERETILDLVRRHRRFDTECWQRHLTEVIHTESRAAGLDPLLVAAIVARESSFRSRAESTAGARGLMQVRPFVGYDVAVRHDVAWRGIETLHEPRLNVRLGATYYRELVSRFEDAGLALAAYHRGPTRLSRQLTAGSFGDSLYARRVLELYASLDRERQHRLVRERG
jgi:soluble lytic murein transglycosylase-like protein